MHSNPTPSTTSLTRRAVLGTATAAASVAALAACSPQGGSGQRSADESLPVRLGDIPVGGAVSSSLNGSPILISRPETDEVVAFSAICTHQGCVVQPASGMFQCPCHGSEFNSTTGAVIQGPATRPLPKYTATVSDGKVNVTK